MALEQTAALALWQTFQSVGFVAHDIRLPQFNGTTLICTMLIETLPLTTDPVSFPADKLREYFTQWYVLGSDLSTRPRIINIVTMFMSFVVMFD